MVIIIELRRFSTENEIYFLQREAWSLLFSIALSYKGFTYIHLYIEKRDNSLCTKLALCLLKNKIFLMWNSDQDAASVRSNTSDICHKKSHIEPKYMKIMIKLMK